MDNQLAILEKDKERLIEELRSADREVLEADLTREVRVPSPKVIPWLTIRLRCRLFINWKTKLGNFGKRRNMLCANEIHTDAQLMSSLGS